MNRYITLLSLIGGTCTFLSTTIGSSLVFFFKKIDKTKLDIALAISTGIMLSSSFFSLINPAINMIKKEKIIIPALGILTGSIFIIIFDYIYQKILKKGLHKTTKLITSITLHNIPEGLILGVSFGSIIYNINTLTDSIMITLAVAIQNFPEGCAISLPLRRENNTRLKSFIYGSLSAIVEPLFAVVGCILTLKIKNILPFMLTFAAGAMIYVITTELIPEYSKNKRKSLINIFFIIGFIIMMILDVYFT